MVFHGIPRNPIELYGVPSNQETPEPELEPVTGTGVNRNRLNRIREVKELAPDHASWAITEYLCLLAEGRRDEAIDTLERDGLPRLRAWEQAAQLLLSELDPKIEADRRAPIAARLEAAGISDHRDDPKPHEARE